jgi:G2/mitotic-specific cyclin 1/2
MNFLRRISKADNYDIQTRTLGKYLMEISLLDHRFMDYLPSHVAAASMYLARTILERGEWVCDCHALL